MDDGFYIPLRNHSFLSKSCGNLVVFANPKDSSDTVSDITFNRTNILTSNPSVCARSPEDEPRVRFPERCLEASQHTEDWRFFNAPVRNTNTKRGGGGWLGLLT